VLNVDVEHALEQPRLREHRDRGRGGDQRLSERHDGDSREHERPLVEAISQPHEQIDSEQQGAEDDVDIQLTVAASALKSAGIAASVGVW
jgi:hypothetical protein